MVPSRTIVVVGDPDVGKTSLLTCIGEGRFPIHYHQQVIYGGYGKTISVDGNKLVLQLWDPGDHLEEPFIQHHARLRALAYTDSAVIVICFDINDTKSFQNIKRRWIPEVLHFCSDPKVPILLVGCKMDLRPSGEPHGVIRDGEEKKERVSTEQGHILADDIGAVGYLECSAKAGIGVEDVQLAAGRAALAWDPKAQHSHSTGCNII